MNINTKTAESKSGIYKILNKVNGKVYVGQSKHISQRKSEHFRSLKYGQHYNKYLQRSFDKYGNESFSFEVIECCPVDRLNERERHWIKELGSEYASNGYNAAYATVLFDIYDKNKKLNHIKRKPKPIVFTREVRQRMSESTTKYFAVKENRYRLSMARSTISYRQIELVKEMLYNDYSKEEIAKRTSVGMNKVVHISNLNTFKHILPKYNYYIKNREYIQSERQRRKAMTLYRDGCSYKEIGDAIGLHPRNAMRIVKKNKNMHDDRCRLNVIERAAKVKTSLAVTLDKMGYNNSQASKLLGVSRGYFHNVKSGKLLRKYDDVNQVRSKVKPFNYNINHKVN